MTRTTVRKAKNPAANLAFVHNHAVMGGRSAKALLILMSFAVAAVTVAAQQTTPPAQQAQQPTGTPLTLTAALQLAMEKNPDIAMARQARTASATGIAV